MFEISRSPQQIFEDHCAAGVTLTYTNTTSNQIVITGVVMALSGAPGDFAAMYVNAAPVQFVRIEGTDVVGSLAISAEIILGPTDTISFHNTSAAGTLGFCVSGWLYNPNG